MKTLTGFGVLVLGLSAQAEVAPMGDLVVTGLKYPNSRSEGETPIRHNSRAPRDWRELKGFNSLLPFIQASPDQEEAGSCLYMSLTGITEWWLARLNPKLPILNDGPMDLSERYLMNLAGQTGPSSSIANWKTDSIYAYNWSGRAVQNRAYRFTKGWFTSDNNGEYVKANSNTQGAEYGTQINWIDESSKIANGFVALPKLRRNVLYADPASDQWNVGVAPANIVERVKQALVENQAPVHVIYNHMGYWHAVYIVGFDDEMSTQGCGFMTDFLSYMKSESIRLKNQAAKATDPTVKQNLLNRAAKFERTYTKANQSYQTGGGCHAKGMFYVRDSIYADNQQPSYDYDPSQKGDEAPYSLPVVLHEYEWLSHLGNHMVQILPE